MTVCCDAACVNCINTDYCAVKHETINVFKTCVHSVSIEKGM